MHTGAGGRVAVPVGLRFMMRFSRLFNNYPALFVAVLLLAVTACSRDDEAQPSSEDAARIPVAEVAPPSLPPVKAKGLTYADDTVKIRIVLRTADQLSAFYIGRGFNQAAIDEILATCFVTPIVQNKTFEALWLVLDDWRFSRGDTDIPRLGRDYWPAHWEAAGLPQAQQSTFGWTLLPEVRDLRHDEGAGGSVVIPKQDQPFTLTMHFHTGADKQGPVKTVIFEDLTCTPPPSQP